MQHVGWDQKQQIHCATAVIAMVITSLSNQYKSVINYMLLCMLPVLTNIANNNGHNECYYDVTMHVRGNHCMVIKNN